MDFFIDYLVTFWSKLASLLLDKRMVGIDLELMNHNIWADASHVLMGLDKHKAKVEPELGTNLNFLI